MTRKPKSSRRGCPPAVAVADRTPLAQQIRSARLAVGLTQEQAAERAGVGQGRWAKWETGQAQPDTNSLCKIAAALGRSVLIAGRVRITLVEP